ncbi:hypothetical protein [[Flexibacter] sp. ATCC 35208]|uniref:hypothetical protein n=1 Tax=[Flexibacter] sp. ATCC 35208 TaxID=1936242 RepID=UPI0009D07F76|nr:hypothetical protein [[Flexibacter] sp. ATCC 35208]OMP74815.1 hypothetical protein BW716_33355 [[Flexibacter] sp. ATCC 35208]
MLTEVPPFGSELGLIGRIDFQVRADQNVFDDVRLTLINGSRINKLHLSIKSNQQISKNGIPAEISRLLWEQYLQVNGLVFDRDVDLMGQVQAPAPVKIANDLRSILQQAREQNLQVLTARNQVDRYNSKQKRQVLQSFECPANLREQFGLNENSFEVAACFYYQEHDFEHEDSASEQRFLELCQKALINPDLQQAVSLMETLCHLPRKWSALSAYVDRAKLAHELTGKYALVEFPSFKYDWSQLEKHTQGKLSVIQDQIGNRLEFARIALLEQLKNRTGNLCFLTGALAKHLAQSVQQESAVVWLDSYDLEQKSITAQLKLHHNFEEVLSIGANRFVFCIIDGAEKLSDFGFNFPYSPQTHYCN